MKKKYFILVLVILSALLCLSGNKNESLKEAKYYEKLQDNLVKCNLCPNKCFLGDGQIGDCGVRKNIKGTLYSLVYNKPVAVHIDPIEKKPLYHFYPATTALSIATVGCNMRCNFCQNWEISQSRPNEVKALTMTPQDVVESAKKYGCESIAFTYTEPTVFYEYMLDIAKLAHKEEIKTVFITCGYINEKPFRELCKYLDGANIDLKGFSDEFYSTYTTATLQPVLNTLKIAKEEGLYFEITNLVIPEANDDPKVIRKMCEWIRDSLGVNYPLHFSRFFPKYKLLNRPPTPLKTLEMARDIALDVGIKYVYIGNIATESEDTYCPNCGKKIIDRSGYFIESINIEDGKCKFCGKKIYGVWEKKVNE
ncbi:MAG: AmmeMemoRadiSam system radical SAM enzyme [Candidatus Cloacimonetes bacterium]|nr:AmmeMemoRadiSam system radical SAM enzyme [Candidatus Cloacimonadota bacterium]MBL7086137.1 AmmeMemoRadiSam system radical SAM enzyme [Candidatus Cloacimonadota bacterium]